MSPRTTNTLMVLKGVVDDIETRVIMGDIDRALVLLRALSDVLTPPEAASDSHTHSRSLTDSNVIPFNRK